MFDIRVIHRFVVQRKAGVVRQQLRQQIQLTMNSKASVNGIRLPGPPLT